MRHIYIILNLFGGPVKGAYEEGKVIGAVPPPRRGLSAAELTEVSDNTVSVADPMRNVS